MDRDDRMNCVKRAIVLRQDVVLTRRSHVASYTVCHVTLGSSGLGYGVVCRGIFYIDNMRRHPEVSTNVVDRGSHRVNHCIKHKRQ